MQKSIKAKKKKSIMWFITYVGVKCMTAVAQRLQREKLKDSCKVLLLQMK